MLTMSRSVMSTAWETSLKKRLRSLVAALRRDDNAVMSPAKIIKKTAVCNSTPLVCHSMFTASLARFAFRHSRGLKTLPLFIEGVPEGGGSSYASRDKWQQNEPMMVTIEGILFVLRFE